jgi:hypothetical protein
MHAVSDIAQTVTGILEQKVCRFQSQKLQEFRWRGFTQTTEGFAQILTTDTNRGGHIRNGHRVWHPSPGEVFRPADEIMPRVGSHILRYRRLSESLGQLGEQETQVGVGFDRFMRTAPIQSRDLA